MDNKREVELGQKLFEAQMAFKQFSALKAEYEIMEAGVKTGGYVLRDVNTAFNLCGHYPEWIVQAAAPGESGLQANFCNLYSAALEAAARRNEKSADRWRAFMNA